MRHPDSFWTPVGHFYAPIDYYGGRVLKYQGGCTEGNRALLEQRHPAGVILDSYVGDRILAADHSPFTGAFPPDQVAAAAGMASQTLPQ